MSNSVLIDRDYLQELVDCANVPDVDPVYQVQVCVECGWEDQFAEFCTNVDKHKAGCPKQSAIKAAMKALES